MEHRGRDYAAAGLIGTAAVFAMLPVATILGTGGLWTMPDADAAQALTGHLAFQAPGWHWPLLLAPDLAWPGGSSIAMTDSNPLFSLAAKLAAGALGRPVNLLGLWVALCWALQPMAAVYAVRSMAGRPLPIEAVLAAAVLSLLCPAWLMRFHHVNLLGHFLLLVTLGLAVRMTRAPRGHPWWTAGVFLTVAILMHPYLFLFAAVMLSTPALNRMVMAGRAAWPCVAAYGVCCACPVALLWLLSGSLGMHASGFGVDSMNLLSPVWPQLSGLFGAGLPIIDATGGQYEGFNYQGAGVLLLIAVAALSLCSSRRRLSLPARPLSAMLVPMVALTLLALTPRVYAGHWLVLPLPLCPWDRVLALVRASGRAFWVVGYALMTGSVVLLAVRLPRRALIPLLTVAVILQIIDTRPLRASAAAFFAGSGQSSPSFALSKDATLLRIVPACAIAPFADRLRLVAIRQGLHLADMRLAHPYRAVECQKALAIGLTTEMASGEARFFLPVAAANLRSAALGAEAKCFDTGNGVLCSRAARALSPRFK